MSTATGFWKNCGGRVVDGKFPLRQWLGGSDHSAAFLTERTAGSQKAVIKLIRAENRSYDLDENAQLSRWASGARLSHPHLIRLFEYGRCTIDGTRVLYVVMEYAEENLAEILPLRALAPAEASEMLRPTAEALAYLYRSGLAHGRIRPSNIMAVGNQLKISADSLRKIGERDKRESTGYDAPEVAATGVSPTADIWSLGLTLVAVLTQNEPNLQNSNLKTADQGRVAVPESIPQPLREIARQCLQLDPQRRCTLADILSQLDTPTLQARAVQDHAGLDAKAVETQPPQPRSKQWIVVPIAAAIILLAWAGSKFMAHQPAIPVAETHSTSAPPPASAPPRADAPAAQSPSPSSEKKKPAQKGAARGNVLQQVLPDVSRNAQNTITGHVKVSVHVSVDASGNVSEAKFVSAGPSKYFAERALEAARHWKFTPPQVDGHAEASEWVLRFQIGRGDIQVSPIETKP